MEMETTEEEEEEKKNLIISFSLLFCNIKFCRVLRLKKKEKTKNAYMHDVPYRSIVDDTHFRE